MSFEALKSEVDLLSDSERRRLIAYLVSVEHGKNTDYGARMKAKIESENPANWMTLQDLERRLRLDDNSP